MYKKEKESKTEIESELIKVLRPRGLNNGPWLQTIEQPWWVFHYTTMTHDAQFDLETVQF